MRLEIIHAGLFKLDGGAMFGVVPKSIWQKLNPADENNMCTWAARCLLVETDERLILIDTGLGDKQGENFFRYYYRHGENNLHRSIAKAGITPEDITDVMLTHLHFDHCGGSVVYEGEKLIPTFKNARYWLHSRHWDWACEPNRTEKSSFLTENFMPLYENDQLAFLDKENFGIPTFDFFFADGHTEKQTIPIIQYKGKTVVFTADLIPSVGHIPVNYFMGYDTRPLVTMEEKDSFLRTALEKDYILLFDHDPTNECCTLQQTTKGIRVKDTFRLSDV